MQRFGLWLSSLRLAAIARLLESPHSIADPQQSEVPVAFHITPDGPKRCRVDPSNPRSRGCRYGEHFDQLSSATDRFETLMEDATAESLQGVSSTEQMQAVELAQSAGALSAEQSRLYAHWSLDNGHLHNGSAIGSPQELFYYSSPQGRLELERRNSRHGSRGSNPYEEIARELESYDPEAFKVELDEEGLGSLIAQGRAQLQNDSSFLEEKESWEQRRNIERGHYLIAESHRWLSQLDPEEQEAISSLTSDGGVVLHHALGRIPEDGYFPPGLVDEHAIYEAYPHDYDGAEKAIAEARMELAQRRLKTVVRAFDRAPKLKEPAFIARGTTSGELHGILGLPEDPEGQRALFDSIEAGDWTGKPVAPEASLRKHPESATLSSSVARSFSKSTWNKKNTDDRSILLAIKSKTLASPANVSAWGTGEVEVYTNPTSDYRILGGRRMEGVGGYFILEIEEL